MKKKQPYNAKYDDRNEAKALKSDKEIWVKVDGGRKMTFFRVIKVNSAPGVTPITQLLASRVRKLKVGESFSGHGDATIQRVAKPVKKPKSPIKAVGPAKPGRKSGKKGLSGAKPRKKAQSRAKVPSLFPIKRAKWNT